MALVLSHTNGSRAIVRLTANATIQIPFVPGTPDTPSDIGRPSNEPVEAATITQLWFSTTGTIKIIRNGVTLFTLNGTDHWNFREGGFAMTEQADQNVTVQFSDANSSLVIEFVKYKVGH